MATNSTVNEEKLKHQTTQTAAAPVVTAAPTAQTQEVSAAAYALPDVDYTDYAGQYNSAMERLQQVKQNLPTYNASYDQSLQDLLDEIMNYDKFSYSTADDLLYQNYKQQYSGLGRMAMQDTMGQAAALTGGYGNSYSQRVGQQQYGAYLSKLNDLVPELYGMAYQQYRDDLDQLENRYTMTGELAAEEYQKYQDRLNSYYQELGYWKDQADTAYDRKTYAEQQAYEREQDAYRKQQDAYDRLADMITTMGYNPTAAELAAAGMSEAQKQAYLNYYTQQNTPTVVYRSSGKKKNSKTEVIGVEDKDQLAKSLLYPAAQRVADSVAKLQALEGRIRI